MPLPVAHTLAGATVHAAADADGGLRAWQRLALAVFVANAPDLDMIPGLLLGDPNRWHHGPSHSIGAAVIVGLLAAAVASAGARWPLRRDGGTAARTRAAGILGTALMVGGLWLSHVALDAVTQDLSEPVGVPLLWPLSSRYWLPYAWFPYVDKLDGAGGPIDFVVSLLNAHNLQAVAVEAATLLPVLAVVVLWRRGRDRARPSQVRPSRGDT